MSNLNPYRPPTTESAPLRDWASSYACPKCGGMQASKVNFNWWGGAVGPRLFNVVRCDECRTQYNGRTGGKLTTTIIVYQLVAFGIGIVIYFMIASS